MYKRQGIHGADLKKVEADVDKLIEKAPEQKPEHKYIDAKLMTPQQLEVENFRTWDYTSGWYSWYYETDKKIGFTARVDRGRAVDPIIRALAYNEEVGSNTQFVYSQGTFIDVMDLDVYKRQGESTVEAAMVNLITEGGKA